MLVLSGIVIMILGLAFRFNALLVILVAGLVTGLAGGLGVRDVIGAIGKAFVTNRYMSLFILILPVIGIMERHGLRERAEHLIGQIHAATAGRICMLYLLIRQITVALGISLAGIPAFVRPLIAPMAEAAALHGQEVSPEIVDQIRAMAASSDNIGNFFGQNMFIASGGLLLIKGVMEQAQLSVNLGDMVIYCIPTAIVAYILASIRYILFDGKVKALVKGTQAREVA